MHIRAYPPPPPQGPLHTYFPHNNYHMRGPAISLRFAGESGGGGTQETGFLLCQNANSEMTGIWLQPCDML